MARKLPEKIQTIRPVAGKGRIRGLTRAQRQVCVRYMASERKLGRIVTWGDFEKAGVCLPPSNESEFRKHIRRKLSAAK